jgi:hypothetical protein
MTFDVVGGGVVVIVELPEPLSLPPQAANMPDAVQIAPRIILDFMTYSP